MSGAFPACHLTAKGSNAFDYPPRTNIFFNPPTSTLAQEPLSSMGALSLDAAVTVEEMTCSALSETAGACDVREWCEELNKRSEHVRLSGYYSGH